MASSVVNGEQVNSVDHIPLADQDLQSKTEVDDMSSGNHGGVCSICLDNIALQDVALVKGCEHTYCVNCILRWASYKEKPTCPQCKHPFEFLNIHRSLDGRIHDYMFEESVCLLLRAPWFEPLVVDEWEMSYDDPNDYFPYEYEEDEEEDDLEYAYFNSSSSLRIGNRRWGDNGYVRAGRQEARPVHRPNTQHLGAGTSRQSQKKEVAKVATGRRAKRALKREAADKAAAEKHAAKHQEHLVRLGRNQEPHSTSD